jgi:hypothetical protein
MKGIGVSISDYLPIVGSNPYRTIVPVDISKCVRVRSVKLLVIGMSSQYGTRGDIICRSCLVNLVHPAVYRYRDTRQ